MSKSMSVRNRRGWSPWALGVLLTAVALLALACAGGGDEGATNATDAGGVTSGAGVAPEQGAASRGDVDAAAPGAAGGLKGGIPQVDGDGAANLPDTLDRTIIRNGSVDLEVESVAQSFERVRQVAEGAGGFVTESRFTGSGDEQSASLTLRVPAERFGDVVAQLQGLATEVLSVSSSSQDVTAEYTDLQSSLRNLTAVEQQYLTLLGQAEEVDDILLVQDRLNGVRAQIEQVQGRINLLDNLADLATVRVTLAPEGTAPAQAQDAGFTDRVADAWASSLDAIQEVGTVLAVALVWSWWLIPVLLVAAFVARRYYVRAAARARVDTPEGAA